MGLLEGPFREREREREKESVASCMRPTSVPASLVRSLFSFSCNGWTPKGRVWIGQRNHRVSWAASIRHLMWKPSATSSRKFGQKWSLHVMQKVLVLKAQGRHAMWSLFWRFWGKFRPEKITSRDGCFLPVSVGQRERACRNLKLL